MFDTVFIAYPHVWLYRSNKYCPWSQEARPITSRMRCLLFSCKINWSTFCNTCARKTHITHVGKVQKRNLRLPANPNLRTNVTSFFRTYLRLSSDMKVKGQEELKIAFGIYVVSSRFLFSE